MTQNSRPDENHGPDSRAAPWRVPPACYCLLLTAIGLAVFSGYLDDRWIFDDAKLINDSAYYQQPFRFSDLLSDLGDALVGATMHYWRPSQLALYRAEYALFGLNPRGWHLTAALLHIAAAGALFWLVRRFFDNDVWAFAAVLLFLLHPANSEVVGSNNYQISAGEGLLLILAVAAALRGWRLLVFALVFAALGFRESALVAPALVAVFVWRESTLARRRQWAVVSAAGAAAALYVVLRLVVLGQTPLTGSPGLSLVERVGFVAGKAAVAVVAPAPQLLSLNHPPTATVARTVAGWAIIAAVIAAQAWLLRRARRDAAWRPPTRLFAAGLLCAAPYAGLVSPFVLFAEHYLYLPLAFLLPAAVAAARRGVSARSLAAATAILAVVFGAVTYDRAGVFHDNVTAFGDVARKHPDAYWARLAMGRHYLRIGDWTRAEQEFAAVTRLGEPGAPEAWKWLGVIAYERQDYARAADCFGRAGEAGREGLAKALAAQETQRPGAPAGGPSSPSE